MTTRSYPLWLATDSLYQAKKEGSGDGMLAAVRLHEEFGMGGDDVVMMFGGSYVSLATRMEVVVGLSLGRQAMTQYTYVSSIYF